MQQIVLMQTCYQAAHHMLRLPLLETKCINVCSMTCTRILWHQITRTR